MELRCPGAQNNNEKSQESSSDAEFRAYNAAGCEALFLRKRMRNFTDCTQDRNTTTSPPPATMYLDNTAAIKWLKNQSHHSKTNS